jgi:hypothetical protein
MLLVFGNQCSAIIGYSSPAILSPDEKSGFILSGLLNERNGKKNTSS